MRLTAERDIAELLGRYRQAVGDELRQAVPDSDGALHDLVRYHLGWQDVDGRPAAGGGKALRPILCLMACEIAGGDWRRAVPAAAALELVHNFSLVHDDIQDSDTERRHRATVWSVWGVPKAIGAGNAIRTLADQVLLTLASTGMKPALLATASEMLTCRYLEMIEGQYLDMAYEQADRVTVEQYTDMIGRKTGALMDGAMYLGGLAATEDPDTASVFGRCGRRLGLAFQVQDDILGIWGDPTTMGKAIGADIRRKKKSLPVVYMLEQAQGKRRRWLQRVYRSDKLQDEEVQGVLVILEELGAQSYAQEVAEAQRREALSALDVLELSPAARHQVEVMAEFIVTRQS